MLKEIEFLNSWSEYELKVILWLTQQFFSVRASDLRVTERGCSGCAVLLLIAGHVFVWSSVYVCILGVRECETMTRKRKAKVKAMWRAWRELDSVITASRHICVFAHKSSTGRVNTGERIQGLNGRLVPSPVLTVSKAPWNRKISDYT